MSPSGTFCSRLFPEMFDSPSFDKARTPVLSTEPELSVDVIGERRIDLPKSTPIYTIESQQIDRQGSKNAADVLKNLPGFAINDVGYGADIHTGTYYRGASINQMIILLNGRSIGSNVNTYHGATDLNSIPVGDIDRIELSSPGRIFRAGVWANF